MICNKCKRHVPIENKDTGLCASCNYESRDDDPLYKMAKDGFIKICIKNEVCCPRCGKEVDSTFDIHHKAGREGYADEWARQMGITKLLDVRFFLAVDRECHEWIELNPNAAKARGWSYGRLTILKSPLSPEDEESIRRGSRPGLPENILPSHDGPLNGKE
jgi:hypothetical protein